MSLIYLHDMYVCTTLDTQILVLHMETFLDAVATRTAAAGQKRARIAVCGAGWWSQGWHLPHLDRHPQASLVAIVEPNPFPRSAINPLESVATLGQRYGVPTYESLDALLASDVELDGVLVCTSHASHFELGSKALGRSLHVLMEKPMTTDCAEAYELNRLAGAARPKGIKFMVNNVRTCHTSPRVLAAMPTARCRFRACNPLWAHRQRTGESRRRWRRNSYVAASWARSSTSSPSCTRPCCGCSMTPPTKAGWRHQEGWLATDLRTVSSHTCWRGSYRCASTAFAP